MYAKIIKDHIDCTDILGPEFKREGLVIIASFHAPLDTDSLVLVRVLDDDRIPYFELIASPDDETLENVMTWCMNDSGATILQLKNEQGEWYDVIS